MSVKDLEKTRGATQFKAGSEQVETARKGAAASVKSRREKASMLKTWETIRKMTLMNGEHDSVEQVQSVANVKGANLSVEEAMILAITQKAMKGDVRAFEALSKYTEQVKQAQVAQKAAELANKKAKLEIERLEIQLKAYKDAIETADSAQVVILDDVYNETE